MTVMPLTVALVISNRSLWEQTHACIQNLPIRIALEQNEPDDVELLLDRIERHRTDVVLIEAHTLSMPLEDFIGRLRETASQPAVFVLHHEASRHHIMQAIHAGAAEFLYPPVGDKLRESFERLSAMRAKTSDEASSRLGRVFGFLSARGGCGATTFACHVAVEAAKQLKQPVLLADFDFEAGLIRFVLKAKNTYSVRDALDNMHRMDSSYWKALVSTYSEKLDVIPAPEDVAAKRAPGGQELVHLLRFIRSVYPLTIVDFGRHISNSAFDALPELEALYVLAMTDLETLEHTRDCIVSLSDRGLPAGRTKVLLNRMPEKNAPDPKGFESYLGMPHAGVFSNDATSLYDAWSEGHLLEQNTRLGRELGALASSIVARTRGERPEARKTGESQSGSGGVKRLLSFLQRSKEQ